MATFLFKTEPSECSFADLVKAGCSRWDGVRNPGALIALRSCKPGDDVLIYHTGDERAVVGLARVVSAAYEDPSSPGRNDRGEPRFAVVDVEAVASAKTPLALSTMRGDERFAHFELLKQSRLSVMPVPAKLAKIIRTLAGMA